MGSVNKVIIVGNLGKDPEIRATQDGREIASLTVATSESWKDKSSGERKEKTEWHRVVIFNENLVRVVRDYAHKGSKLYIEGQIATRKWQDKDGQDRFSTEIVVQGFHGTITLLDRPKAQAGDDESQEYTQPPSQRAVPVLDDEIPFAWIIGICLSSAIFLQLGGVA